MKDFQSVLSSLFLLVVVFGWEGQRHRKNFATSFRITPPILPVRSIRSSVLVRSPSVACKWRRRRRTCSRCSSSLWLSSPSAAATEAPPLPVSQSSTTTSAAIGDIQSKLVALVSSATTSSSSSSSTLDQMSQRNDLYRDIQQCVNELEGWYSPPQTLGFLNLALQGEWEHCFCTHQLPLQQSSFLSETLVDGPEATIGAVVQQIDCQGRQGRILTRVGWGLTADETNTSADALSRNLTESGVSSTTKDDVATGTLTVNCTYQVTSSGRMVLELEDHIIQIDPNCRRVPDLSDLVQSLHRNVPRTLFDPSQHAMDVTYMDGQLRIVRYTGPKLEGVRDIFLRRFDDNPVSGHDDETRAQATADQ